MIFTETQIAGLWLLEPERNADERGFFARTWCRREFEARGLDPSLAQCNVSYNERRGTLRGLHFQHPPHAEAKLVRCTSGAIFDVIVDLRPRSSSYLKWQAFELTARNYQMLYIPAGMAHGFLTLADASEVFYQMSTVHVPTAAAGLRWNDPALAIVWPEQVRVISDRDANFPLLADSNPLGLETAVSTLSG